MAEYSIGNNTYSYDQIVNAANASNMSLDDYLQRSGAAVVDTGDEYDVKGGLWNIGKEYLESIMAGWETGRTNEENLEVFKGSTKFEDIEAMIRAGDSLNKRPQNERMKRFQKKVKDNGGGFISTLWALVGEDPVLASQIATQSLSMMAGALYDSGADIIQGKTGDSLGYAAAGSGVGAATFGTLGSVVPGLGNLVGAGTGAIAGSLGGLSTALENGLTFAEMLKEDMAKDNLEWTTENAKKYLESEDNYNRIRSKALGRGLTIGAVDLLSGGFAGAITKNVGKNVLRTSQRVRKAQKVAAGVATEGGFGGVGELLGQKAGGQEYDAGEIVMEAFASTPGALVTSVPQVANIRGKGVYKLNGQKVTEEKFKEETNKMSDLDIAKADIEIENDNDYAEFLYNKQNKATLDALIDPKVTDVNDREKLVELEIKRQKALSDTKKEGINKVPDADKNLQEVQSQIDEIIGKYEGAQTTEALLQDETSDAFEVAEAAGKRSLRGTVEFARKAGEALGIEYVDAGDDADSFLAKYRELTSALNASQEDVIEDNDKGNELIKNSDGLIIKGEKGSAIIINKQKAARTGAVSVGSHEILHAVLGDHLSKLDDSSRRELITDFRKELKQNLDSKSFDNINKRLANYQVKYAEAGLDFDINTTDEWFTALSDAIVKNEVKYSESFGQSLKKILGQLLRATPFKNIEFDTGRQAFDFIKDYSENAQKGVLIAGAAKFAGKQPKGTSLSISQQDEVFTPKTREEMVEEINDIYQADTSESKDTAGFEIALKYRGQAETIFQRYLDTADLTQDQIDVLNDNKEDIISMLLYDKIPSQKADSKQRTVLGLVKDFESQRQKYNNVAAYVNQFFKERAKEVFKYFLPDAFVKSTTDEKVRKTVSKKTSDRTATEITDKKDAKPLPKVERQRDLKQLSEVNIDSKEQFIQDLKEDILQVIKLNPANVNNVISQLIKGGINKRMMDLMGKISKKTGVSEQYKSFHDVNFDFIQKSIPTAEIKKRYGKLFQIVNTGKREATAQGNSIFIIKPIPKAQFGAYFTVGKEGTLIERKRSLAEVLTKGLITKAANDLIIENSTNNDAIFNATLENVLNEFDKQRGEFAKADAVSLSLSIEQKQGVITELLVGANENGPEWYENARLQYIDEDPGLIAKIDSLVNENPNLFDGPSGFIKAMERYGLDKYAAEIAGLEKGLTWRDKDGPNVKLQEKFKAAIQVMQDSIPSPLLKVIGINFMGYKDQGRALDPKSAKQIKAELEANTYEETGLEKDNSSPAIKKAYNEFMQLAPYFKPQIASATWFKNDIWNNILSQDVSLAEKVKSLKAISNDLQLSAKAAKALLKYLTLKTQMLVKNKKLTSVDTFVMGQLQANIVKGFRAFSVIRNIYLTKGKQVGMFSKRSLTQKEKNTLSIEEQEARKQELKEEYENSYKSTVNWNFRYKENQKKSKYKRNAKFPKTHKDKSKRGAPRYNTDAEHKQALINATISDLRPKNEHLGANALSMAKLNVAVTTPEAMIDIDSIWKDHQSFWGPKWVMDIMDDKGGRVNLEGVNRLYKFLPKSTLDNVYGINGEKEVVNLAKKEAVSLSITEQDVNNHNIARRAVEQTAKNKKPKGISIWDFDDTLATTKSKIKYTTPDGKKGSLTAEQYAKNYVDLAAKGYQFDFSEFNKVVDGKKGPLFNKALARAKKFGTKDQFILTARPPESRVAIYNFLKGVGLNIPLENITGLANSTAIAKALWITEKVSEGYNDIYFADDALQNVQVVQDVLNQFDVKSKVQQAKKGTGTQLSLSQELNEIIDINESIDANKTFSKAEGEVRGRQRTKTMGDRFFNTAGSNDFMGLMYTIAKGVGKEGDRQIKWMEDNLYTPYKRGIQRINNIKQGISNNYKALVKSIPNVNKKLKTLVEGTNFTYDAAVRVYLWDKAGFDIPGLSESARKKLVAAVQNDADLMKFADQLGVLSLQPEGYTQPNENWTSETILSDLDNLSNTVGRKEFLKDFIDNRKEIFGEWQNGKLTGPIMAKLEALYGPEYVDALNDMIWRMENGNNRVFGSNKQVNRWMNWITNSIGAIMFFNTRSALLQTLSTLNFINWGDNNPVAAAKALANFPQFLKDFVTIFNSDFLKQRRGGLKLDVNEAALANSLVGQKNKVKAIISYLLKKGFLPTQIADSFAIAAGGATFLRNRTNTYLKQGLSLQEAEAKAFQDMVDASEPVQQSSDPALISKEQASILGRMVLAFQNVTMQYSRRMKKAIIDLAKRRGDFKTNVSRILYYGFVQNVVFNALQSALFALSFDDDLDEEKKYNKQVRVANGMSDSLLRGLGVPGAVVSTAKNVVMEYYKQNAKGFRGDQAYTLIQAFNVSPPIGSKARKLYSASQTEKFNKKIIPEMSLFDISNPRWQSIGTAVEAFTNVPMGRAVQKLNNIKQALSEDHETWQRISLMLGYNTWDVGVTDSDIIKLKEQAGGKKSIWGNKKPTKKSKSVWGGGVSKTKKKSVWGKK